LDSDPPAQKRAVILIFLATGILVLGIFAAFAETNNRPPAIHLTPYFKHILWVFLALFLLHSGFFSASETALFSLDRLRLSQIEAEHPTGYRSIKKLLDTSHSTLTSILLLNRFANVGATISAGALSEIYFKGNPILGFFIGAVSVILLILILGEIMPKTYAIERAKNLSRYISPILIFYIRLAAPLRYLVDLINGIIFRALKISPADNAETTTEEDLKMILMSGEFDNLLGEDEKEMIDSVLELREKTVDEVMTPRIELEAFPTSLSQEELIQQIRKGTHSRVIIYDEDLDHILGTLHVKELLLHPERPYLEFIREPFKVPMKKELTTLLREMQKSRIHMAVVLDEYGGTAGIATMHDLLEEIVGDIKDAKEAASDQSSVIRLDRNHFQVLGKVEVAELNENFGLGLDEELARSMGGYVFNLLGRVPIEGEVFESSGWRFYILRMDGNRIDKVSMKRIQEKPKDE